LVFGDLALLQIGYFIGCVLHAYLTFKSQEHDATSRSSFRLLICRNQSARYKQAKTNADRGYLLSAASAAATGTVASLDCFPAMGDGLHAVKSRRDVLAFALMIDRAGQSPGRVR
jgi:hypothetical protein